MGLRLRMDVLNGAAVLTRKKFVKLYASQSLALLFLTLVIFEVFEIEWEDSKLYTTPKRRLTDNVDITAKATRLKNVCSADYKMGFFF